LDERLGMSVGDLVRCINKKPDEPDVGEFGFIVKSDPVENLYVAWVPFRGQGRIWAEDWETISICGF